MEWFSRGGVDPMTDPMTNVTLFYYDCIGPLTSVFLHGTNRILYAAWSETGELTNLRDGSGWVGLGYNHQGLRTGATTEFGSIEQLDCDVLDRATNIVTAEGPRTALVLDSLGRLQQRIAMATGITNTETFGYTSGVAAAVAYTNQTGDGVVLLAYDLLGQLTNQVFSGVATNRFTYNAAGDLTGLIDGLNQQTAWAYDLEGRASSKTQNNSAGAWTSAYNANGWLTNHWTPARPNVATYRYDAVGNPTNIAYTGGVSSNVSLTYDKNNRLVTMDDAVGHTAFAWTPWGALASEDGPWADDTVAFSHNASGLRSGLSLLQPGASAWSQTCRYDAAGNLTNRSNGNFWQRFSQSADGLNQLSGAVRATDASYTVAGMVYGLAMGVTVKQNAETIPTNATLYADGSFVRTNVTLADGTNLLTAVVNDALDRSGTNTALAWLPATVSFTYDANGNLSSDGRRTFAYDDEDQLVSVTVTNGPNSSTRSTFAYDALGRRRVRTEYAWLNNAWVQGSVTRYVYDHMLVLQERDGDHAPTATYTRGLDLSGSLQGAGGIGGLLAFTQLSATNPRHTYYHADAGGNVTALIDDRATVLARYAYDPYGNLLGLAGPMAEQNLYRFSNKEFHSPSGLYYYGYRFYEPSLQRWLNRDPIGEAGGVNLYAFSFNRPANGADAYGLTYRSSLEFLWNWLLGRQPVLLDYPPNSVQSIEMQHSPVADQVRSKFYNLGCPPAVTVAYTTERAFFDTAVNPFTRDFSSTAFQVGGCEGKATVGFDATLTICIKNRAGTHSFFYHYDGIPDMPWQRGPMRTVHQRFEWKEPIDFRKCRRWPTFPLQRNVPPFLVTSP
jgi:RHS repeat-associated protein